MTQPLSLTAQYERRKHRLRVYHPQWGQIAEWSVDMLRVNQWAPSLLRCQQAISLTCEQYETLNPSRQDDGYRDTGLVRFPAGMSDQDVQHLLRLYQQRCPVTTALAPWTQLYLTTDPLRRLAICGELSTAAPRLPFAPYRNLFLAHRG